MEDYKENCRSEWSRGLRGGTAAAGLLRLWVRIPPGSWKFIVSVVCSQVEGCSVACCQVEVTATS